MKNESATGVSPLVKKTFGLIAVAMIAASVASGAVAQADKELVVAEPVHSLGYLPLYVAIHKGFFAAEHLSVKVVTITSPAGQRRRSTCPRHPPSVRSSPPSEGASWRKLSKRRLARPRA